MLRSSISQIHVRREVQQFQRQRTQRVSLHIPSKTNCTEPGCGWDEFTQSGKDVACLACNGTGKVTTWYVSHSSARVMWIDPAAPVWGTMASGPVGDVWLSVPLEYESMFDTVKDTGGAYILLDGRTVKPIKSDPNRVEGKSSQDVRCEVINV